MVATVSSIRTDNTCGAPLVVELAGPAGAGKTTLLQALCQRSHKILISEQPQLRKIGQIPFFLGNAIVLLPTLFRLWQTSGWLAKSEITRVVRLRGWHRLWERQVPNGGTVVVLDQGPVYTLATLHGFGPESLRSRSLDRWWNSTLEQWASILDIVVWLDAPDMVLVERINARSKAHLVKGETEQDASAFLARYRTAYEQVLSMLSTDATGPRVLRFDTAQASLDEIVNRVLMACGMRNGDDKSVH